MKAKSILLLQMKMRQSLLVRPWVNIFHACVWSTCGGHRTTSSTIAPQASLTIFLETESVAGTQDSMSQRASGASCVCLPSSGTTVTCHMDAGDGTWVLTLTHSKDLIDIIVSPAPAMFSWSLWEYVNFVDGQPRAQGKHLCLIPRWLSWLVDFVGFVVFCQLNTS